MIIVSTSKYDRSLRRERKRIRKINGMRRSGDSVKLIQRLQIEKAEKIRKEREEKERIKNGETEKS